MAKCGFKNKHQNGIIVYKRDWVTCSKFSNMISLLNNNNNNIGGGDLYDHLGIKINL